MPLSRTTQVMILSASLLCSPFAAAEDIDLFQGGVSATGGRPNVLFVIDNSANWARADQNWPGGIKQGEAELSAIIKAIEQQRKDLRVGLMMSTDGPSNLNGGGYVRFAVRDMDEALRMDANGNPLRDSVTNARKLQTILGGIRPNFNGYEKTGTAKSNYDNTMYEVYRYFSGKSPYAGGVDEKRDYYKNGAYNLSKYTAGNVYRNALAGSSAATYRSPLSADNPCVKNFIIYIGNGYPSQGTDPSAYSDTRVNQLFNRNQIYATTKVRWADEWARFLKDHGAEPICTTVDGVNICTDGRIQTYTIDVYNAKQDMEQTQLLRSMASVGGGEYFAAKSEEDIVTAINTILNEVQAVDSVFTSASLPVSVNTQGSYLNQIYMGVFRPDANGRPRWMGNLKQYRFGLTQDANGEDKIYLADSTETNGEPTPAVNSATGFIKPSAHSYWSYSTAPNDGFWKHKPKGVGGQYDAPDGELVEKGGAAQRLRDLGPTNRKVYTCLNRDGCMPGSTPDLFQADNLALLNALTFTGTGVTLSRKGPTVHATTVSDLGLVSPTDTVTISGATVVGYNNSWSVTKTSGGFTFSVPETPETPATGTHMTVAAGLGKTQTVPAGGMTFDNDPLSATYGLAKVNLPAHGFIQDQTVEITGASDAAYNGTYRINVTDGSNFTYAPNLAMREEPPPIKLSNPLNGVGKIDCGNGGIYTLSKLYRESGANKDVLVAVTSTASTARCTVNGSALISGVTDGNTPNSYDGYNAGYIIKAHDAACPLLYGEPAWPSGQTLCFTVGVDMVTVAPASPASGSIQVAAIPTRKVVSMSRTDGDANNVAEVTIVTDQDHGFLTETQVFVSGADQREYNGTKTTVTDGLSFPDARTIKFKLTTGPEASAVGQAARGYQIAPGALINWMRGAENKEDENGDMLLSGVRASVHGDVLHSRPVVINYGDAVGLVAFYGGNDGMLRAVKAGNTNTDGTELWSFVSPEHYGTLGRLYNNLPTIKYPSTPSTITPTPIPRNYYFDGNIGVFQTPDLKTTHIFVAMRRGGRAVYAFDVSDPRNPKFMWKRTNRSTGAAAEFAELGPTFSEPKVIPIKKPGAVCDAQDSSTYIRALVFGAGYDPVEEDKSPGVARKPNMGRGIFVLDAATGNLIKFLRPVHAGTHYSFAADITLVDSDADTCIDRFYAVDTGANIHRFDITTPSDPAGSLQWSGYHVARLGDVEADGGSNNRKFLYAVDAVLSYDGVRPVFFLLGGTGDREAPRDTLIRNHFYMIKDALSQGAPATEATTAGYPRVLADLEQITVFDQSQTTVNPYDPNFKGWYLPYSSPGEKTVNAPLTVAGVVYFGTNVPKPTDKQKQCTPNLGIARGYAINFLDGTSAAGDRNQNGTVEEGDLYTNFIGGGLPPSPVTGIVKIGEKFVRFIIGAGGTGTNSAAVEGYKVRANPSSNRTRVYWYFKKDQ